MRVRLGLAAWALSFAGSAAAVDGHGLGRDWVAAGGSVDLATPVAGDAILTGGDITTSAPVAGRLVAAGGDIALGGEVAGGAYAAGASILVSGGVHGGARLYAARVGIGPAARIDGRVAIAARRVTIDGVIAGPLTIDATDVMIAGRVDGDLEVSADRLEVADGAHLRGRLRYRGPGTPQVAPGAVLDGGLERAAPRRHWFWPGAGERWRAGDVAWPGVPWLGHGLGFPGSVVLAPAFLADTSREARTAWGRCLGAGIGVVLIVPGVALMAGLTLIGIPLALLLLAFYVVVLAAGHACGVIALADLLLERARPIRAPTLAARVLAVLATLLLLFFLRGVPLVGGLFAAAVYLVGVGALTLRLVNRVPAASAAG